MKLILLSLLALVPNTLGLNLDDLVNPLALSITESVADNLTAVATTLIPKKTGHKFAPVHSLALTKVHNKFKQAAPVILKSHSKKILKIRKQFGQAGSKRQLSLARVESLLTLRDLQVKLFTLAREETAHFKRQTHALVEKRDALTKIEALEDIILKIVKWKDDHPEAIQELIKVEKALAELIRPGPDGSLMSSQLGKMLTLVAASQLGRFWMYPAVFAAGAISMVGIYGLFKWILATNATASNGTSAITTPSVSAPQGQTSLPASLAPFEIPF